MEKLLARATLTHKRETVSVFTAFPLLCFWTLNGYLDLFFILAHSQLLRIALRGRHVHSVASKQLSIRNAAAAVGAITRRIYVIREQKVMLDRDLAKLYGVPTKVFNQAIKRNRGRFLADFMFQLTAGGGAIFEVTICDLKRPRREPLPALRIHAGRRPSVLKSERAVQVNIAVMRAFVSLREMAVTYRKYRTQTGRAREAVRHHDHHIKIVFDTLRKLIQPPEPPRRPIGFVVAHRPRVV